MQQFPTSSKNIPTINKWIPRNIQSFFHIRKKKINLCSKFVQQRSSLPISHNRLPRTNSFAAWRKLKKHITRLTCKFLSTEGSHPLSSSDQFHRVSYLFWRLTASWLPGKRSPRYLPKRAHGVLFRWKGIDKSDLLPREFVRCSSFFFFFFFGDVARASAFHPRCYAFSFTRETPPPSTLSIHTRDRAEGFVYVLDSEPQLRSSPRYSSVCFGLRWW